LLDEPVHDQVDPQLFVLANKAGMGALMAHRILTTSESRISDSARPLFQGTLEMMKLVTRDITEFSCELIGALERKAVPVTLLKGISVSDQYYPHTFWRPMRDIDLLVAPAKLAEAETALMNLGYVPSSDYPAKFYETHHHSMPLHHPEKNIWVELHTELFSPPFLLKYGEVFSTTRIQQESLPSTFCGRRVTRLSPELQLVYICSHWAEEIKYDGGMVAMLDIFLLLRKETRLDWEKIIKWLHNTYPASYVYLLLSYLERYNFIQLPDGIMDKLAKCQKNLNRFSLRFLHRIIDDHIANDMPFGRVLTQHNLATLWQTLLGASSPITAILSCPLHLLFPPHSQNRFQLRHQLKRLKSAISG
ncbi:MAG: nucleotidyltransferase family protein, partial [Gammaproteobacteria bacterium]|nr:nucleotidyltransferase family protein [Gammaproteobacteria bacterium]